MSGQVLFLAMLILSEIDEVVACAQQLPQYWGKCWFLVQDKKLVPLMFRQSQAVGKADKLTYSKGWGEIMSDCFYFGDWR